MPVQIKILPVREHARIFFRAYMKGNGLQGYEYKQGTIYPYDWN